MSGRREVAATSCGKTSLLFRSTLSSQSEVRCKMVGGFSGRRAVLRSLVPFPHKVCGFGLSGLLVVGFDSLLFDPFGDFSEDLIVPPPLPPFCQCLWTTGQDVVQYTRGCSTLLARWVFLSAPDLQVAWGWQQVSHRAQEKGQLPLVRCHSSFQDSGCSCAWSTVSMTLGGKLDRLQLAVLLCCLIDSLQHEAILALALALFHLFLL